MGIRYARAHARVQNIHDLKIAGYIWSGILHWASNVNSETQKFYLRASQVSRKRRMAWKMEWLRRRYGMYTYDRTHNRTRQSYTSRFIVGERLLFIISSPEQETHKERHEVEWHFRNSVEAAWCVHDWLNHLIETNSFYKQYITEGVNRTEAESSILRGPFLI
jgi:hypothetical protein